MASDEGDITFVARPRASTKPSKTTSIALPTDRRASLASVSSMRAIAEESAASLPRSKRSTMFAGKVSCDWVDPAVLP